MFGLSIQEVMIVGVVAVLLFGRNLPSVARSMGATYRQFRSQLNEFQSQINLTEIVESGPSKPKAARKTYDDYDDRDEISAPKFQPPPAEPQAEEAA